MRGARLLIVGLRTLRPARFDLTRTPALRPGRTRRTLDALAGRRPFPPICAFRTPRWRPLETTGRRQRRARAKLRQIAPFPARANVPPLEARPIKTLRPRRHGRARPWWRPHVPFHHSAKALTHRTLRALHRSRAIPSQGWPAVHLRAAERAFRCQEAVQAPFVLRGEAAGIHLLLQILELLLQFTDAVAQFLLFLSRQARLIPSVVVPGAAARSSQGVQGQAGGQPGGQQTWSKESLFHNGIGFAAVVRS